MVTPDDVARLTAEKNYLEPLQITAESKGELVPGALMPNWFGFSVYGIVMAYRCGLVDERRAKYPIVAEW